ncbi:MAG TPA: transcription termination factor NusA, partial [Anaerolineaceae bacterium]|nr:transcription termination factor NusA [Anaerolineaceae bacterium]
VNASNAQNVEAHIDPETGKVQIMAEKEVVESVQDERTEVTLEEARRFTPTAELGMIVVVESTPTDFGRVAAQTARQVIQQRIRDAERQAQMVYYQKQLGEIISGVVQAVNSQALTIGLEMRAEGMMARKDMIPGERFRIHDRVRAMVAEVKDSPRGPQIILSRTHRDFLRRLLENEVPEIYHGVVEIRSIAREPGERAKVAVSATQSGIDPVGACVGIRGVRIQAIVRELHDEKIDVIEWNPDPAIFIAKAISPARVTGVYLNERSANGKTATVVVPEDQLSLAIGRDGQNARLAAKLTSWRIDIKSLSEAVGDSLHKLIHDTSMQVIAEAESANRVSMEAMLAKKAEGRALTPEEYDQMGKFVDRVERRTMAQRQPEKQQAEQDRLVELRKIYSSETLEKDILDSGLADHVAYLLQEAGYLTVGDLVLQMNERPDDILRLQGIGPRAMAEISRLMDGLKAEAEALAVARAEEAAAAKIAAEAQAAAEALAAAEAKAAADALAAQEAAVQQVEVVEQAAPAVEEEEPSFDKLFTLPIAVPETAVFEDEEEGEGFDASGKKKTKKKKKKTVEVEYDPDRDMMVVKRKHKGTPGEWDWEA